MTVRQFYQSLGTFVLILAIGIAGLFSLDVVFPPYIKAVNVQGPVVSSQLDRLELTFSRGMDRRSVEQAFALQPPLKGTIAWRNNTFIFQFDEPVHYDQDFSLTLSDSAHDIHGKKLAHSFERSFRTLPVQVLFIGTQGTEADRLILLNTESGKKEILTDEGFIIESFASFPGDDSILLLGARAGEQSELYRLELPSRELVQLTDDSGFVNYGFAVSPTGEYVTLSRVERSPSGEYLTGIEVWLASTKDYRFSKFLDGYAQGSDVFFSFDGSHLLFINDTYAYELAPLTAKNPDDALFIGKEFNNAFGFHPFKPILLLSNQDNADLFTVDNDLVLFHGDGSREVVPFEDGITRDSSFSPDGKYVVTIFSGQEESLEDALSFYPLRIFHMYVYDLETGMIKPLTDDPGFSEEDPVVSPNGEYILFRRFDVESDALLIDPDYRDMAEGLGSVAHGELWLYDLFTGEMSSLGVEGRQQQFYPVR